jgi:hypothetical protein
VKWPGWPFRVSVSLDVTFGPVAESPEVDQKTSAETQVSYHDHEGELGLTPKKPS